MKKTLLLVILLFAAVTMSETKAQDPTPSTLPEIDNMEDLSNLVFEFPTPFLESMGFTEVVNEKGTYVKNGQKVKINGNKIVFLNEKNKPIDKYYEIIPIFEQQESAVLIDNGYVTQFYSDSTNPAVTSTFSPELRITAVTTTMEKVIIKTELNPGVDYTYTEEGSLWVLKNENKGTIRPQAVGSTTVYIVNDFGNDKKLGGSDDQYVLFLPDGSNVKGTAYAEAEKNAYVLLQGEQYVARISSDGRIESNFRTVNGVKNCCPTEIYDPTLVTLSSSISGGTFIVQYNNKGIPTESTVYPDLGGRRVPLYYSPTGSTIVDANLWKYEYNEKGELSKVKGPTGCPTSGCTFEELKKLKEFYCKSPTIGDTTCKHFNGAMDKLKTGFWERWDALRKGAGAGQGYCNMLDIFGVDCGDSLFPAFDDFLQNSVIGNVLSGETSALCQVWTDNPPSSAGGNVALGPGGFAAAWIAAESITFPDMSEIEQRYREEGEEPQQPPQPFLYKLTFEVKPSNIVDGECEGQIIAFKITVDGQTVDLDFDGNADSKDIVRLECDKGGYSATGRRAIVRYSSAPVEDKLACIEFENGGLHSFFKMALDGNKLCNTIVPVENVGYDFTCPWCLFGDTGFVEVDLGSQPNNPVGDDGSSPQNPDAENRPNIGNP